MAATLIRRQKRSRNANASTAATEASAPLTSCSESSSKSESCSESEEDEVARAMFRPAPHVVLQADVEDVEQNGGETENGVVLVEAIDKKETVAVRGEQQLKKTTPMAKQLQNEDDDDDELRDEIDRKTEVTIYVEGIPYRANESDLVTHFASCGTVREVRLPRYQDSGKPRGYAHVVFDHEAALEKALQLDNSYLFNRYLSIRRAEAPRIVEMALKEKSQNATKKAVKGCRTVYIKQLPYDVDEDTIRGALASSGTITSVRLPMWNHTQKLKGFGYVEFSREDEALAAARRSGMKIGDRMVLISLDAVGSAPKASFRQRDGQYWNKGEEAKKSLAKKLSDKQQRLKTTKKQKTSARQRSS